MVSHRWKRIAGRVGLSIATTVVCLELALRVFPLCVPSKALVYYREDLRGKIAKGRFATRADTVRIERDDGGPELRLWRPFYNKPYGRTDPGALEFVQADEIGFSNPAGTYTSNATVDVVTIGDSFTWAHAVPPTNTWSFRLGRLTGLKTLNLGKGGTGLYEYLQVLKHYGLEKHPRYVVMNVYEGNDIRDAVAYHEYRGGKQSSRDSRNAAWKHVPGLSGSYVYNLIGGSIEYALVRRQNEVLEGAVDFRYWVDPDNANIPFNSNQGAEDEVVFPRHVAAGKINFAVFDDALRLFASLAAEHRFVPVIMYSPAACIVYAPVRYADPALNNVLSEFSRKQREYFSAQSGKYGMRFVDLTDSLRAAAFPVDRGAPDQLLYFPGSLHYTSRGHEVAATVLANAIARERAASAQP